MIARAQLGLTRDAERWRLRAGRLYEIHRGVYALTPILSEDGYRAAVLLATHGSLSHESTLHLFGLISRPAKLHVTVVGERRRVPGLAIHRTRAWAPGDLTRVRGLSTTTVSRALLDVATTSTDLRALVREAQYRKLIDPLSLRAVVDGHRGHPGAGALAAIEPTTGESGLEKRLGTLLPEGATPQHWLIGLSGRRYRSDFAYLDERVFIEADGRDAHARMLAFEDDRARDNDIAATGWLPLRYTSRQLTGAVTVQVTAALERRR